jgi:hypothetical protein
MSGAGKSSAVAAVASELGSSGGHTPEAQKNGEQGDLLRAFEEEVEGFEDQAIAPPKRRAGRPEGSPNRSTLQLQKFLMQRGYRDPAEFLASVYSMDVKDLARRLGCKAIEALEVQRKAAAECMPYFHQRMPQAVHHTGDGARPLIIIADGPRGGAMVANGAEAMSVHDLMEYQEVSASQSDWSDESGSDDQT